MNEVPFTDAPDPAHSCPVCGFDGLHEAPRSESGGGSYEICPCCGFQFGVDDDDRGISYEEARQRWIAGGARWFSKSRVGPSSWPAEGNDEAKI